MRTIFPCFLFLHLPSPLKTLEVEGEGRRNMLALDGRKAGRGVQKGRRPGRREGERGGERTGSEWGACVCPPHPVPASRLLAAPLAGLPSSFQSGLAPGSDWPEMR